jgi:hypothetical protein
VSTVLQILIFLPKIPSFSCMVLSIFHSLDIVEPKVFGTLRFSLVHNIYSKIDKNWKVYLKLFFSSLFPDFIMNFLTRIESHLGLTLCIYDTGFKWVIDPDTGISSETISRTVGNLICQDPLVVSQCPHFWFYSVLSVNGPHFWPYCSNRY